MREKAGVQISYDNEKIDKEEMVEVLKIEGVKVVVKKLLKGEWHMDLYLV